jgi:predicted nucleic acid-binding protein
VSVFVGTLALLAVLVSNDLHHADAVRIWRRELEQGSDLVTSNYVVVETIAVLQHRVGVAAVRTFVRGVVPALSVAWVAPEDHEAATTALLANGRRGVSLVDRCCFQVMRRLGLERVFAFDRHFANAGFKVLNSYHVHGC